MITAPTQPNPLSYNGIISKDPIYVRDDNDTWVDLSAPDNLSVPHVFSFNALVSTGFRTFFNNFHDEAIKHRRENAMAMRRDAFLFALLRERKEAVLSRRWDLKIDNDKDPWQIAARDGMTKAVSAYRWHHRMVRQLLDCIWYGKSGVQIKWGWKTYTVPVWVPSGPTGQGTLHNGTRTWMKKRFLVPVRHMPVNGDKINWTFSGQPTILINPAYADELERRGATTIPSTDGGRAVILEGTWRDRFIISTHNPDDADYFAPEMGSAAYGVGLRSRAYWNHFMRNDFYSWVVDSLQRTGLGLVVLEYDMTNPKAEDKADEIIRNISRKSVIKIPVSPEKGQAHESVRILEAPTNGIQAVMELIKHQEKHLERLFVGQSASANSETSGMGTHDTDFQQETKAQLTRSDSIEASAYITGDEEEPSLISTMQKWGYPDQDFPVWYNIIHDEVRSEEILGKVFEFLPRMKFSKDAVYDLMGMESPEEGEDTIGGEEQEIIDQQREMGMLGVDPAAQFAADNQMQMQDQQALESQSAANQQFQQQQILGQQNREHEQQKAALDSLQRMQDPDPITYYEQSEGVKRESQQPHTPHNEIHPQDVATGHPNTGQAPQVKQQQRPEPGLKHHTTEQVDAMFREAARQKPGMFEVQNVPGKATGKFSPPVSTPNPNPEIDERFRNPDRYPTLPEAPPEQQPTQLPPSGRAGEAPKTMLDMGAHQHLQMEELNKQLEQSGQSNPAGDKMLSDFINEASGNVVNTGGQYALGVVFNAVDNALAVPAATTAAAKMPAGMAVKRVADDMIDNMPATSAARRTLKAFLPTFNEVTNATPVGQRILGALGSVAYLTIAAGPAAAWKAGKSLAHIPTLLTSIYKDPATAWAKGKEFSQKAIQSTGRWLYGTAYNYALACKNSAPPVVSFQKQFPWVNVQGSGVQEPTLGQGAPTSESRGEPGARTIRTQQRLKGKYRPGDPSRQLPTEATAQDVAQMRKYADDNQQQPQEPFNPAVVNMAGQYMDSIPTIDGKLFFEALMYENMNLSNTPEEAIKKAIYIHQKESQASQQPISQYSDLPPSGVWPSGNRPTAEAIHSGVTPADPLPSMAPSMAPTQAPPPTMNQEELQSRLYYLKRQQYLVDNALHQNLAMNTGAPQGGDPNTNQLQQMKSNLDAQIQSIQGLLKQTPF